VLGDSARKRKRGWSLDALRARGGGVIDTSQEEGAFSREK